jgi:hypothetical protein
MPESFYFFPFISNKPHLTSLCTYISNRPAYVGDIPIKLCRVPSALRMLFLFLQLPGICPRMDLCSLTARVNVWIDDAWWKTINMASLYNLHVEYWTSLWPSVVPAHRWYDNVNWAESISICYEAVLFSNKTQIQAWLRKCLSTWWLMIWQECSLTNALSSNASRNGSQAKCEQYVLNVTDRGE